MITSTRIGRYGNTCNSLFQFAAVIGMSNKTNINIVYLIMKHIMILIMNVLIFLFLMVLI